MKLLRVPLLLLFVAALAGCSQIDTGNVGVERSFGKVSPEELPPGVYSTLFKSVDEFTTKEVAVQLTDLRPKSRDNLTMQDVDIDVYFKVDPGKVADLFVKYQGDVTKIEGGDYAVGYNRMLREAREAVYKSVAGFDATTMHTKRAELSEEVRKNLQAELEKSDKGSFFITNVNVRNLVTDANIENAIRERAKVDQQIEAKRKEIELAKAEAERQVVEAEGHAKSNRILAESLTPALIRMKEIEAMQAFAKQGNSTVVLPAGGATPLINLK